MLPLGGLVVWGMGGMVPVDGPGVNRCPKVWAHTPFESD